MNQPKTAGLVELMMLQDYMAAKFEKRVPLPKNKMIYWPAKDELPPAGAIIQKGHQYKLVRGQDPKLFPPLPDNFDEIRTPVVIKNTKYFPKIFDRHWNEYQQNYPGASPDQYRRHAAEHLTRQIETIRREAPSARDHEIIKLAEIYINDFLLAEDPETGINCQLNPDQLKRLFAEMQGHYIKGREIDFLSALTPDPLPPTFKRLKWIDKAAKTGQANKSTLRAFLTAAKGGKAVTLSDAQKFVDDAGKAIELNKPRRGDLQSRNVKRFTRLIEEALNPKPQTQ
jgi:hypothetical protein